MDFALVDDARSKSLSEIGANSGSGSSGIKESQGTDWLTSIWRKSDDPDIKRRTVLVQLIYCLANTELRPSVFFVICHLAS